MVRLKISRLFSLAAVSAKMYSQDDINSNQVQEMMKLKEAQKRSARLVRRLMNEVGAPGLVVAVSVDGTTVWTHGFGYSDVENHVRCSVNSVMRVASISKSFTAVAMARLWEDGKLNLDKAVQEYVPDFPEKDFEGSKVSITLRQLLSHTSGIRHYSKYVDSETSKNKKVNDEFDLKEYYLMKPYKDVFESLSLFKDDPLLKKPGQDYLYTTHGWTLISAIMEKASGTNFLILMSDMFRRMGMTCTTPDFHQNLIYGRSKYYRRTKFGKLENAPYVDNSYKWAGGGFLSTVGDLVKFGNVMLYSFQQTNQASEKISKGYLRPETVRKMWSSAVKPKRKTRTALENASYGLGWAVFSEMESLGCCPDVPLEVSHSGGAVGASSVLFLMPNTSSHSNISNKSGFSKSREELHMEDFRDPPKVRGVTVAIICNLQSVGLTGLARSIAHEFDQQLQFS